MRVSVCVRARCVLRKALKPWRVTEVTQSLTFSSCIPGAFCAPLLLTVPLYQSWVLGDGLCHAFSVGISTSLNASLATLCLISLDRLNAVTKPFEYRGRVTYTQRWRKRLALFVWVHSVFWASAPLFGWGEIVKDTVTHSCKPNWSPKEFKDKTYSYGLAVFAFTIPAVVMVIVYCVIYWRSKQSGKWMRERSRSTAAEEVARQKHQRGILRTVLAIIGAFTLCWITYTVATTFKLFARTDPPGWLINFGLMLALMNSAINPGIYAALDKDIKKQFRKLLRCCKRKHTDLDGPPSRKTSAASLTLQAIAKVDNVELKNALARKVRMTYVWVLAALRLFNSVYIQLYMFWILNQV